MRYVLACLVVVVGGCASADVGKMSAAELCYARMVDEDTRPKAEAEITRRKVDCNQHSAEVKKMHEQEQRAGQTGGGYTEGTPRSGGTGLIKDKPN
jgi:hypothetical protein